MHISRLIKLCIFLLKLVLAHENGAFSNPQPYLQMSNTNMKLIETMT
jgi:hypothetical protein